MRTVGEYKELNIKIADYMEWEHTPMETECGCCRARLPVGEDIVYDKNYNAYCDNRECGEGIAVHHTTLEPCWWGEEYWDTNNLDFQSSWSSLLEVIKKLSAEGKGDDKINNLVMDNDILGVYNIIIKLIEI